MLMLEEQHKWYLPAIDRIGWHSAAWNTLGVLVSFLVPCPGTWLIFTETGKFAVNFGALGLIPIMEAGRNVF